MVAVNAWDEPNDKVREFVREHSLPYTIVMNGSSVFRGAYQGGGIPHNYLLDCEGQIIYAHLGWDAEVLPELEKNIQNALAKQE